MKVGDMVKTGVYPGRGLMIGMIIGETNRLVDPDDSAVEKVFNILWDNGNILTAGSTFLRPFCEGRNASR